MGHSKAYIPGSLPSLNLQQFILLWERVSFMKERFWSHFFVAKFHQNFIRKSYFFSLNQQSEYKVIYKLMCWLSGSLTCRLPNVMKSPPPRRSLVSSIIVDWFLAPRRWGFYLKSKSTNYPDHGHHEDPPPTRKNPHGRAGNQTPDLVISSQKLWPLD